MTGKVNIDSELPILAEAEVIEKPELKVFEEPEPEPEPKVKESEPEVKSLLLRLL